MTDRKHPGRSGWTFWKVLGLIAALLGMSGFGLAGLCGFVASSMLGEVYIAVLSVLGLAIAVAFGFAIAAILRSTVRDRS